MKNSNEKMTSKFHITSALKVYRHLQSNQNLEREDIPPKTFEYLMSLNRIELVTPLVVLDLMAGKQSGQIAMRYGISPKIVRRIRRNSCEGKR